MTVKAKELSKVLASFLQIFADSESYAALREFFSEFFLNLHKCYKSIAEVRFQRKFFQTKKDLVQNIFKMQLFQPLYDQKVKIKNIDLMD